MDAITEPVLDANGMIIKYIGDASMHIHNAPIDDENHAFTSVTTAFKMLKAVEKFNEDIIIPEGRPPVVDITLLYRIFESKRERIHTQFSCELGHRELKPQRHLRHAWRTIRMDFWFVGIDSTTRRASVGQLVTSRRHESREARRVAAIGTRVHHAFNVGGD